MSLSPEELRRFSATPKDALQTLEWLQSRFFPAVQSELNSDDVRRRLALYAGERIPDNERNLTDVRNRVSLIIEYELARLSTRILERGGVETVFWSYVVANRFPDLEVRDADGKRHLRVEVKCLQSIAEEKSANFDTLRKDLHPATDFIVVFLWEWRHDPGKPWDRAPYVLKTYVFHAVSLSTLRDCYWLNNSPSRLGDGRQGFDLRYAINCREGKYNQEEGNYGKLLRLWQKDFQFAPIMTPMLRHTEADYLRFQIEVFVAGFDSISTSYLPQLSGEALTNEVTYSGRRVGWSARDFIFILDSLFDDEEALNAFIVGQPQKRIVRFSSKYSWKEVRAMQLKRGKDTVTKLSVLAQAKKPKRLLQTLALPQAIPPVS